MGGWSKINIKDQLSPADAETETEYSRNSRNDKKLTPILLISLVAPICSHEAKYEPLRMKNEDMASQNVSQAVGPQN